MVLFYGVPPHGHRPFNPMVMRAERAHRWRHSWSVMVPHGNDCARDLNALGVSGFLRPRLYSPGTRLTSSKQPRISAKNHLMIAFKRRVSDIVRRYLLPDRCPKVTAWLFCNWYIEFNREHDSTPQSLKAPSFAAGLFLCSTERTSCRPGNRRFCVVLLPCG